MNSSAASALTLSSASIGSGCKSSSSLSLRPRFGGPEGLVGNIVSANAPIDFSPLYDSTLLSHKQMLKPDEKMYAAKP